MSRLAVVGTGYVGLTTGACMASLGHDVVCADMDSAKIKRLQAGDIPIHEAGMVDLVTEGLAVGRMSFVVDAAEAVGKAEFVFLCLPTPENPAGSIDLTSLMTAVRHIAPHLPSGAIVINKSTVPVGSVAKVADAINRDDVEVVSNPEFLREGTAIADFLSPDRIVIGANSPKVGEQVAQLYESLSAPTTITDPASAETTKFAANAFLATKLSFANNIAAVCEDVGADVLAVLDSMGLDRRIGRDFFAPGPGWGGSCLPKDTRAMLEMARAANFDDSLLRGVINTNQSQLARVVNKVMDAAPQQGAVVALLGLAFKAGTDDIRMSPAIEIAKRLVERGAQVQAFDPAVKELQAQGVAICDDPYAACEGADVLLAATEWPEFAKLDLRKVAAAMRGRQVVDARNILDRQGLLALGFSYQGIGRSG